MNLVLDKNNIWATVIKENIFYPEDGNISCFNIEKNSFWFQHRNNIIKKIIQRFPFNGNFADIGGGNGYQALYLSNYFPQSKFFLIEPGYAGCMNAKNSGLENVFNVSSQDFPYHKFNIAGIGLFDVIEHIKDDVEFLSQLSQRCKKETLFYITVPAHHWLWSDVDDFGQHYRRHNKKSLGALAKKCNLDLLFHTYFFAYLIPFIFLFRSLPYKFGQKRSNEKIMQEEQKQHHTNKTVSFFFDKFNKWELGKLNNSPVPFGASCFAVFKS